MNILVLGRTYDEHMLFSNYDPCNFIDTFNIKKGSHVLFVDIQTRESKNYKKDDITYHDIVGDFRKIDNVLIKALGSNKTLDLVFMDHSTFKFTSKGHASSKENVFYLLFKHNFINKSTLVYIRNMRPKKFVSEKYSYKKEYLDNYHKKLNSIQKKFTVLVRGLGDKTFAVEVTDMHTMNEVKAHLHKIEKVPKSDLLSIVFAGRRVEGDVRMSKFDDSDTLHMVTKFNSLNASNIKDISLKTHKLFEKNDFVCDNKNTSNFLFHPGNKDKDVGDHMCFYHKNLLKKKKVGETCSKNTDCLNKNCVEQKCMRRIRKKNN